MTFCVMISQILDSKTKQNMRKTFILSILLTLVSFNKVFAVDATAQNATPPSSPGAPAVEGVYTVNLEFFGSGAVILRDFKCSNSEFEVNVFKRIATIFKKNPSDIRIFLGHTTQRLNPEGYRTLEEKNLVIDKPFVITFTSLES